MIKDKLFLVGEGLDLLHGSRRDVYVGVRAYF
jgi:phospholipid/cholesterol/gamma-HCH transport system substrate-binding protein